MLKEKAGVIAGNIWNALNETEGTVSYTHLDVYKRQLIISFMLSVSHCIASMPER